MRPACALLLAAASLSSACTNPLDSAHEAASAARQPETASPKDAPLPYRVLVDEVNKQANTVDFHVLVSAQPKHDEAQKLIEYLYRHLMTRTESRPAGLAGYVYSDEAQFKTPPRSPIASVIQKPGDVAPVFEN